MIKKLVAICANEECVKALKEAGDRIGVNVEAEIQENANIVNKISTETIKSADAVLFTLNCTIEDVEDIERFIDCEYYEVEPEVTISNAETVIKEIDSDLN